jgi:hypothetical protein
MGSIYQVTNTVNGMVYIGKTVRSALGRWGEHCGSAKAGSHERLNSLEMEWIRALNCRTPNGYNSTDGGDGPPIGITNHGRKHSLETRKKIGDANRGHVHTEETRKQMSRTHTGMTLTPEQCKKVSDSKIGKPRPPELVQRMRDNPSSRQPEARRKNREWHLANPMPAEARERSNITRRAIWKTDELRQKIAAGTKAFFAAHPERIARGERNGLKTHPEQAARGEASGVAKISEATVRKIRALSAGGMNGVKIANKIGISTSNTYMILSGQTWRHVT